MVRVPAKHEPRLDPLAGAQQLDLLDAVATVLPGELFRSDASCFDYARVDDELSRRGRSRRIEIRHSLRGRLDGGFTGTLRSRAGDDAVLRSPNADHGGGREREREHDGQQRLAVFVVQGVHSTRRAALPSTINLGRPTNPSGTGIA